MADNSVSPHLHMASVPYLLTDDDDYSNFLFPQRLQLQIMPSSGLMLSNGSSRMDGTLSQSMDSVNTVAAEEEVKFLSLLNKKTTFSFLFCALLSVSRQRFFPGAADLKGRYSPLNLPPWYFYSARRTAYYRAALLPFSSEN